MRKGGPPPPDPLLTWLERNVEDRYRQVAAWCSSHDDLAWRLACWTWYGGWTVGCVILTDEPFWMGPLYGVGAFVLLAHLVPAFMFAWMLLVGVWHILLALRHAWRYLFHADYRYWVFSPECTLLEPGAVDLSEAGDAVPRARQWGRDLLAREL